MEEETKQTADVDPHALIDEKLVLLEEQLDRVSQVVDGIIDIVDGLVSIVVGNDAARTIRGIERLNVKMEKWAGQDAEKARKEFLAELEANGYIDADGLNLSGVAAGQGEGDV